MHLIKVRRYSLLYRRHSKETLVVDASNLQQVQRCDRLNPQPQSSQGMPGCRAPRRAAGAPMAATSGQRNYGRAHENICERPRARSEGTN